MVYVNEKECEKAGLDINDVKRVSKIATKLVKECGKLGIEVFGGTNNLSLRFDDDHGSDHLILITISGDVSGGCGAEHYDDEGLLRGED